MHVEQLLTLSVFCPAIHLVSYVHDIAGKIGIHNIYIHTLYTLYIYAYVSVESVYYVCILLVISSVLLIEMIY